MSILNEAHQKFLKLIIKHKVEFVLIGGYAVILHGGDRTTSDIDLLVKPTKENGQNLLNAFKEGNFDAADIELNEFETELFLSFGFEPEAIDIMTFTKGINYEEVDVNANLINIDGFIIKMIDIRDLIKNKESLNRSGSKGLLDSYDAARLKEILQNRKNLKNE